MLHINGNFLQININLYSNRLNCKKKKPSKVQNNHKEKHQSRWNVGVCIILTTGSIVLFGLDIVRIFGNPIKRYFNILFNAKSVSSFQPTTTKVKVTGQEVKIATSFLSIMS